MIQVELKEQCYRWTVVTLKVLKYLNSLLVMALLLTLIQAFSSPNVYDQLPAGAKESASEVLRAAREVEIIQQGIEALQNNQGAILRFVPGLYQILVGVVVCTILKGMLNGTVVKETLLIVRDLGIQTCSHSLGGGEKKMFYDISRIRDFIINDYIAFYYVRQYCAFLVENEKQLVIPFKESDKLRQLDLEYIYYNVKQIISLNS